MRSTYAWRDIAGYSRQIDHDRKGPIGARTRSLSPRCRDRSNPGERASNKPPLIAFNRRKDWLGIWNIWNGASRRGGRIEDLERHDALAAARKEFPPCRIGCGVANCANDA